MTDLSREFHESRNESVDDPVPALMRTPWVLQYGFRVTEGGDLVPINDRAMQNYGDFLKEWMAEEEKLQASGPA